MHFRSQYLLLCKILPWTKKKKKMYFAANFSIFGLKDFTDDYFEINQESSCAAINEQFHDFFSCRLLELLLLLDKNF